ncbi:MAG: hypothetical protein FIA89_01035 [Geobacter sp.]|nr:hypothetical protein [Geobacter sp.]
MPVRFLFLLCLCLSATLLAGGCSTVTIQESWRSSAAAAATPHQKLLIVNLNLDQQVRTMSENIVAGEMRDSGIAAVAGHSYVSISDQYSREELQAAVKKSGSDAILTIRGISTGNQNLHQQGQGAVLYSEGLLPSSWDDRQIATLQVNLYHAANGQLLWTATVKASDDDNKFIESRDLGYLLVKRLRQDGMVAN